tara:strand:- start:1820 stop:2182 length:363 start_codon:yes stop_codon:yes gene_type:complete
MKYVLLLFVSLSYSQIAEDKVLHFVAGGMSGSTGYLIGDYYLDKPQLTGISLAIASGVLKETYDYSRGGKFDNKDLLATTIGGIVVVKIISLTKKSKNEKINDNLVRNMRKLERQRKRKR